jgi:hypothetical protein
MTNWTKLKKWTGVLAITASLSIPFQNEIAQAASDTANATMNVLVALNIAQVSDLVFNDAEAGASSETIAPGSSENANNASFAITGEPSTAYTITLPADATVVMQTGAGGANETIAVDSFASNPAAGPNGLLDGSGSQTLYVGATRAALGASQVAGAYSDTFTVTVVY